MRRKPKNRPGSGDDGGSGGGYEVIYSGFVLILLCFFIMLSSFASIEQGRVFRFVRSFVESLSMLPGGLNLESGKVVLPDSTDMVGLNNELALIFNDLSDAQKEYGTERGIRLFYGDDGLVMQMADTVLFDLGRARIRREALPLLDRVAGAVKSAPSGVRIEGHTDDLPIATGRYPSNWELSTARAVNVLRYFVEQHDISPKRLYAVGYSRYRPLFPNDGPENRARNRRVEIVFENGAGHAGEVDR